MDPKELNQRYQENKEIFHNYIDHIKKNSKKNLYTIINPTLVKNTYASNFPKNYFFNILKKQNKFFLFLKEIPKFYLNNFLLLLSYFISYVLYKIYFGKQRTNNLKNIIDVFGLVDKTIQNKSFNENYLTGIYDIFEKNDTQYALLLRLYPVGMNPFKLRKFFLILNKDSRDFVFEYEFLKFFDFIRLFFIIIKYPFQVLKLIQKEKSNMDKIFNNSLIKDINYFSFTSITRYILGENLSKITTIKNIYSWCEFQVIERSFNYAIKKNCSHINLIGLQVYINYETFFNTYVDDTDFEMKSSPDKIIVNGKHYMRNLKNIKYELGPSLRYKELFNFKSANKENNILLLGSYMNSDTKYLIDSVKKFNHIIFKNHPAVNIKNFGNLPQNIQVSNENIYKLFTNSNLVITTGSGTAIEAVSCGVSVIILSSQDNLTANPLIKMGKGKIWDLAYDSSEIDKIYKKLINYRNFNQSEIIEIANWYKNNFFIEPTEENIMKMFDLKKKGI